MKSLYVKIVLLIAIVSFGYSCKKEIKSNFDKEQRKLVFNSLLNPDSNIAIYLSKSLYPDEPFFNTSGSSNYLPINNAVVCLYKDDVLYDTVRLYDDGKYLFSGKPQSGVNYTVKIKSEGLQDITANTTLPEKTSIDSLTIAGFIEGDDYFNLGINIYFEDIPTKNNYYYLIVLNSENPLFNLYTFGNQESRFFDSNNPVFSKIIDRKQYFVFNDHLFDGENYTLDIKVPTEIRGINSSDTLRYYVYLCSINEAFYNYMSSYNKNVVLFDPEHNPLPLTEPVKIYNNINNGYGIFGAYQISVDSIDFVR